MEVSGGALRGAEKSSSWHDLYDATRIRAKRRPGRPHGRDQPGGVDPAHPLCPPSPQFPRWRPHHSDLLPRGQVAFPGTRCTTLRRLVSRVVESVAQEVAPFGTGMTIVEPGGARTEFRYGSAQVAKLMPVHDRRSGAQLPEDARPGGRSGSRRPGQNGRSHHRQRRRGAGAAAHRARALEALESKSATLRARIADFRAQPELPVIVRIRTSFTVNPVQGRLGDDRVECPAGGLPGFERRHLDLDPSTRANSAMRPSGSTPSTLQPAYWNAELLCRCRSRGRARRRDDPIHQGVAGAGPGPVVAFRVCAERLCNLSFVDGVCARTEIGPAEWQACAQGMGTCRLIMGRSWSV